MKFGRVGLDVAKGAILGHSLSAGKKRYKKGDRLTASDLEILRAAGINEIFAARFDPDDVPEDQAAAAVAKSIAGDGVKISAAFTGRANLYAGTAGVVVIDRSRLDRLNLIDESLTVATLNAFERVETGQMLATVKIIPFSAKKACVTAAAAIAAEAIASGGGALVRIAAFQPHSAGLVLTTLPGDKPSVIAKTEAQVGQRLQSLGSRLGAVRHCPHTEKAVAGALRELAAKGCSPLLIFGASAIVDRGDVVPLGILAAGGEVLHFGMPVDPGNLLLLGRLGQTTVIGLPGCARSPKLNGFDWVLERLVAGIAVSGRDLMGMGVGGLLKEILSRPQPRGGALSVNTGGENTGVAPRMPKIAAIVLAAGQSKRMGRKNKLLEKLDGETIVARVVDVALQSPARPVVVVVGHQADRVRAALKGKPVTFALNPHFADGLSTSLKAGIEALPHGIDGALVSLGDMPQVDALHLSKLISAFNPAEGRAICVPTFEGKWGNPVLLAARFFPEMKTLTGDLGAKHLISLHSEVVREVAIQTPGVLVDIDTPQALAQVRGSQAPSSRTHAARSRPASRG
jgi:molybdenum cofactor cytidylyltransferase